MPACRRLVPNGQWRIYGETRDTLARVAQKTCRVQFRDHAGVVHAVEVEADGLYEAAAKGLATLKKSDWVDMIGPGTRITVQVQGPTVEHFLMYKQLLIWLEGGARNPADALKKNQLKKMLGS